MANLRPNQLPPSQPINKSQDVIVIDQGVRGVNQVSVEGAVTSVISQQQINKIGTSVQSVNGVTPGSDGSVYISAEFTNYQNSKVEAESRDYADSVKFIVTAGYYTPGDGGGSLYFYSDSEPSHPAWFRSANGKVFVLQDVSPDIRQYGAEFDENPSPFIEAMVQHVGYARIRDVGFNISENTTISAVLNFEGEGNLFVLPSAVLTITNRIIADSIYIFRGTGDVIINISGASGEDAKSVNCAWFGIFPQNTSTIDQTSLIRRACKAFSGQTREGILDFPMGSFRVTDYTLVPRALHIRGAGTRRTVFDVVGGGYDVFITDGPACKFSNIMFEQPSGAVGYRDGSLIHILHERCELDDVWLWSSKHGVIVDGPNCSMNNINATYGSDLGADTATILVRSSGCSVDGIKIVSTAGGPSSIVEIGRDASSNFGSIVINDIQSSVKAIPVLINPQISTVSSVTVDGVTFVGSGGVSTESLVKITTTGTGGVSGVFADALMCNTLGLSLLTVLQGSTGITENIVLAGGVAAGSAPTGNGVRFEQASGTLRNIHVSPAVEISQRSTPVIRAGGISGFKIPSSILPNGQSVMSFSFTVANNGVVAIPMPRDIFTSTFFITGPSNVHGSGYIRLASSPACSLFSGQSLVEVTTGILTGTTGNTGVVTVSATESILYVENRRGSQIPINISIIG